MEPKPGRAGGKRRRWLLYVVVVLTTFPWWYWPQRDPRLVGAWSMTRDQQARPFGHYLLHADGTMMFVADLELANSASLKSVWYVCGGKLFTSPGIAGPVGQLFRDVASRFNQWVGNDVIRSALPLVIESVAQDEVVLRSEDRVVHLTLRRIRR